MDRGGESAGENKSPSKTLPDACSNWVCSTTYRPQPALRHTFTTLEGSPPTENLESASISAHNDCTSAGSASRSRPVSNDTHSYVLHNHGRSHPERISTLQPAMHCIAATPHGSFISSQKRTSRQAGSAARTFEPDDATPAVTPSYGPALPPRYRPHLIEQTITGPLRSRFGKVANRNVQAGAFRHE